MHAIALRHSNQIKSIQIKSIQIKDKNINFGLMSISLWQGSMELLIYMSKVWSLGPERILLSMPGFSKTSQRGQFVSG